MALQGINDQKPPGCDRFNAVFFKKAWPSIKEDVTSVVLNFFATGIMCKAFKYTTVTLIPKIS